MTSQNAASARLGLILTATGILSATVAHQARDETRGIVLALGFLAYLAIVGVTAFSPLPRWHVAAALAMAAAAYIWPTPNLGLVLLWAVTAMALRFVQPSVRPLALAGVALWTPAIRLFAPDPMAGGAPLVLLVAAIAALATLPLAFLREPASAERVGLAVLTIAAASAVVERHLIVFSRGLAPDDLLVVVLVPVTALALVTGARRLRPAVVALAFCAYALAGVALILGKPYHADPVAAVHWAAELLVRGDHPYRDFDLVAALARFALDPELATHLLDRTVLTTYSYPALSFLAPAPLVAAGLADIRVLYLAEVLLLALLFVWRCAPPLRPAALAALVGNVVVARQFVAAGVDPLWAVLVAVAFLFAGRRWPSALALGLAAAARQPAWFVAPFYVAAVWGRYGRAEAVRRASIAAAAFALPQLPFLLTAPGPFVAGVLGPITAPLEPLGVGLVRLGLEGALPMLPREAYAALAAAAFLVLLFAPWRRGAAALGLLPVALAWRSLHNYFALAGVLAIVSDDDLVVSSPDQEGEVRHAG